MWGREYNHRSLHPLFCLVVLVRSFSALGSSLLPPELHQLLPHSPLCTWVPALPHEMTAFLPWLLCQFPVLVSGVGSTWPRILPCSCSCSLHALAAALAKTHRQSPVICERTSQTPSASFISEIVPAKVLCCRVQPTCWHAPKPLLRPLPTSPWP